MTYYDLINLRMTKAFLYSVVATVLSVAVTLTLVEGFFSTLIHFRGPRSISTVQAKPDVKKREDLLSHLQSPPKNLPDPFVEVRNLAAQTLDVSQQNSKFFDDHLRDEQSNRSIVRLRPSGKILYDVTYHYDRYGRRQTTTPKNFDRFVALLGCSFTFGQGLSEELTMPQQLAKLRPGEKILNFATEGGAISDPYVRWTSPDFHGLDDMKNKRGILVYVFYDFHMQRILCPRSCYTESNRWIQKKPRLIINAKGEIENRGLFKDDTSLRGYLWRMLGKSSFLNYFNLELPPRWSEKDDELVIALLQAVEAKSKQFTNIEKTAIVIMPALRTDFISGLKRMAKNHNIEVIDFSDIYFDDKPQMMMPFDSHPSALYNWWSAQFLNEGLRRIEHNWEKN